MTGAGPPRCPACRAGFRGAAICSRCGADLTPLMTLVAAAWRLRESARRAIGTGEFSDALKLAAEAQRLHATAAGLSLRLVAGWGAQQSIPRAQPRPGSYEITSPESA